jgi:hypothetical protein
MCSRLRIGSVIVQIQTKHVQNKTYWHIQRQNLLIFSDALRSINYLLFLIGSYHSSCNVKKICNYAIDKAAGCLMCSFIHLHELLVVPASYRLQ